MNVLACYLVVQAALLIAQTMSVPRVLLDTAEPIAAVAGQSEPLRATDDLPADFPRKIWVQGVLRETVARMWATSPTFRRQCLQVQAAGAIQVQIRLDSLLLTHPQHRATCELRLYTGGGLIARISVAHEPLPELIAHEMEHVCERLDGVKVEHEARDHNAGVYLVDSTYPRYETDRAIRVGRQVMAEVNVAPTMTRRQ